MNIQFKTESRTDAGTWTGGQQVIIENTGANSGTVAGKSLAVGESIEFNGQLDDSVQFDYDATAGGGTTLEITYGIRSNRALL